MVTEDDDVGEPLAALLRRAGYAVEVTDGPGGAETLQAPDHPPAGLILDRDLPSGHYALILDRLAAFTGPASFPLLVLGGVPGQGKPEGWHEDASVPVARPPQPAEILTALALLGRLVFYRRYRELVHDLAQPVTTIHALSRTLAKTPLDADRARQATERLAQEAERLMALLEAFQRTRVPG